ncbi:MAG: DUF2066 domain-containing protein [Cycloclasticus sp.]|nr:DUF2066 domain-containing protein [Cycloclasticus sp.]
MRYLLSIILFVVSGPSLAVQINDLYSATVAVDDQSLPARNTAINVAFKKVLRKVSGRASVLANTSISTALLNVGSYVDQFQYKKTADDQPSYWLTVSFQKAALDKFMQQHEIPVWGSNRPDILVWLAVDADNSRYVLDADSTDLVALLKTTAAETGLAVTVPLLDLKDQSTLGFDDVWRGQSDKIWLASQRYDAKQVLFGRLQKETANTWRLNWNLINAQGSYSEPSQPASLENVLQLSLVSVSERLANIYAPRGVIIKNQLIVEINGVKDLAQFVRVTEYLSSLDKVDQLEWLQVAGSKIVLELDVSGDVDVLKSIIALNTVLLPDAPPAQTINAADAINEAPRQSLAQTFYYKVD